jgi:type 1 glutamine amidotransferase
MALGHNKEEYANPLLYGMIERGILWSIRAK